MNTKIKATKSFSLLDVLGDGLSSFRDSVSGELSREDELDSWLNLSGWESSSFVESDQLGSFSGDSVEGVMDERVHDVHGLLWDTDVGVYLFEHFVDVDRESLNTSSSDLSVSFFSFNLGWFLASHFYIFKLSSSMLTPALTQFLSHKLDS